MIHQFVSMSLTGTCPVSPVPNSSVALTQPHTHTVVQLKKQRFDGTCSVSSWTSSITRLCRNGMLQEAAAEFLQMRLSGFHPNHITFLSLISACADFPSNKNLRFGISIHAYICKLGFNKKNVMLATSLVHMYSKSAHVDLARHAFNDMFLHIRNSISWNTMIDGYMRNGKVDDAINLFEEMPERDMVSWTALINGFVKRGEYEKALEWFLEMQLSGVQPDYVTIIALISACANLGLLRLGMWLHCFSLKHSLCQNIRVKNSLIDMYSRCGCIQFARQQFHNMEKTSLVSWNSLIVGFAVNGHAEDALQHFSKMQTDGGLKPDAVSFTGALTACSHAGLVEDGLNLYDTMTRVYKISPGIEHYGCIVDLCSRAGRLEEAFRIIQNMPMKPNEVVIGSLLAACKTQGNVSLAERLTSYLVESNPNSDPNYVLLSNIYAGVGRWDGVGKIRKTMKALGITKTPGFSSIEIDCSIHEFVAGDRSHPHSDYVYAMLDQLYVELRVHGYVTDVSAVALPVYD